ncbi:hypothetical protein [Mesorhizobium tamadayense]|uniref:hypothetical protein n=1 Tax=Mesorhizobium tamadayense TaxID=425306 RepID=UPI001FDEFB2C|nr:hypothetical protein [Mesorhizobium tamadayense]
MALLSAAALSSTTANALDSSGTPVVVTPLASKMTTASGQSITLPQKNVEVQVSDRAGRDADRHERLPANGVGPATKSGHHNGRLAWPKCCRDG